MRKTLVYLLFFPPAGALAALSACGTHLSAVDQRALQNEQFAAKAITARATDGAIVSLAEAVFCSAGGTLKRAGKPSAADAGIPCPSQP